MKKYLVATAIFFSLVSGASAVPQLGITPCVPSAQPADISYSGVSANVHLSTCGETLIVWNNTANDVRYRLGTASTTAAVLTDNLLPAHTFVTLNVGTSGLYFAVISAGTGTVSLTIGQAAS